MYTVTRPDCSLYTRVRAGGGAIIFSRRDELAIGPEHHDDRAQTVRRIAYRYHCTHGVFSIYLSKRMNMELKINNIKQIALKIRC